MLERLIEAWLDSASERSYQAPFCQMLAAEGHHVIHSTRHSPIEFGKDVITIARDGVPCAFQLKGNPGGRLTQEQLREIKPQLLELVTQPIVYPGVPHTTHRCYLVTNGLTDEAVHRALSDINSELERLGFGQNRIELKERGYLLEMATRLGPSLWPSEIEDLNVFLELLAHRGDDFLPTKKLHKLLQRTLQLDETSNERVKKADLRRRVTSAALLTAVALRAFSQCENHFATIAAWTMFTTYVISACERHQVSFAKIGRSSTQIAEGAIFDALAALCDDAIKNRRLLSPRGIEFGGIQRARATLVYALMSVYWFWSSEKNWPVTAHRQFLSEWLPLNFDSCHLWGEAAVPQYLALYWYMSQADPTWQSEWHLGGLLNAVVKLNCGVTGDVFANPYFTFEDVTRHQLPSFLGIADDPLRDETLRLTSFLAEGLMHLFVRANFKQNCKVIWPDFARLALHEFQPELPWHYGLCHTTRGTLRMKLTPPLKNWTDLIEEARDCRANQVPLALRLSKFVLLLFVVLFPYRGTPEVLRFLGQKFGTVWFIAPPIEP